MRCGGRGVAPGTNECLPEPDKYLCRGWVREPEQKWPLAERAQIRSFAFSLHEVEFDASQCEDEWEWSGIACSIHSVKEHEPTLRLRIVERKRGLPRPAVPHAILGVDDLHRLAPVCKVARGPLGRTPPQTRLARHGRACNRNPREHCFKASAVFAHR